jgi:hypothetical protein
MYALSDFWISPLVGTIGTVFRQQAGWMEGSLFVLSCVLLVGSNVLAIGITQRAFQYGPASILIPIRHGPTLLAPIFVYSFVYQRSAPQPYSLGFFLVGALLVLLSAFLLGQQEAQFAGG